jgi:1-acyl-sn-glycerol-3-phosphate acyltransferase
MLYFTITFLLLYPGFLLLLSRKEWYKGCFKLMRFWAWVLVAGAGIIVRVKKANSFPKGPFIICANHSSYLDIILTYCVVPEYFVFMGKQELNKVPLFNIFFRDMNILVDRKNTINAHRAFVEAMEEIDQGNSVAIFPEGTISKEAPKMKVFKNGLFRLAIDKQVPVIPVTFLDNYKLMEDRAFLQSIYRPGIARVVVHNVVQTKGMSQDDLISLRGRIRETIEEPLINDNRR